MELKLCRGCRVHHYWDLTSGKPAEPPAKPSFVEEQKCPARAYNEQSRARAHVREA